MTRDGSTASTSVAAQVARLSALLDGEPLEPFRVGGESRTYRIGTTDWLVTVPLDWPEHGTDAEDVRRRTELLRRIAGRVSVPVPQVVRVLPDVGCSVVRRLEGAPLIGLSGTRRAALATEVAEVVGTLLAELHSWEAEAYGDVAPVDPATPEEWRDETAELVAALGPALGADHHEDLRRFLARPAPAPPDRRVLSHNDLGIEHVLVAEEPAGVRVSGVIDWDDAAITDPAYDFGLLLRDLGPEALDAGLSAYARRTEVPRGLEERAAFYAACTLVEDLAFGHAEGRDAYVEKSLAGWAWTFHAAGSAAR